MNTTPLSRDDNKNKEPQDSALSLVTKLVIVPLVIVAIAVSVFLLFGWMTYDRKSAEAFLADVKTASPSKKWQAAFVLAGKLRDKKGLGDTERLFQGMTSIFGDKKDYDEKVRSYMAMALGNLGDKRAIPLLEKAIREEISGAGDIPIYSMWALGTLKAAESASLLMDIAGSHDSAIRKTALFVLGSLESKEAIPLLKSALEDSEIDIQWNAAFALARLGDASGQPLLRQLLDRSYYESFQDMSFQARSDAMVNALMSVAYLKDISLIPAIERLGREDLSVQVRHAAQQVQAALKELERFSVN
ncbi:MAG: HEAT repeat domain-containing protein [Candidatus Omnitrophica bacterium]|nr:HEAT repeat domain-containing protein [Candidatus Omnitrophota bacterium]